MIRLRPLVLALLAIVGIGHTQAQTLLETGTLVQQNNLSSQAVWKQGYYLLQFDRIISKPERDAWSKWGLVYSGYFPKNTYAVALHTELSSERLKQLGVKGIVAFRDEWRKAPGLNPMAPPASAFENPGGLTYVIQPFAGTPEAQIASGIESMQGRILGKMPYGLGYTAILPPGRLPATLPAWIQLISFPDEKGEPENREGSANHRAHYLRLPALNPALRITGKGVNVIMNDDGSLAPHIDFHNRTNDLCTFDQGSHGDHCAGTIMGAGNLEPQATGNAPGAHLTVYNYTTNPNSGIGFFSFPASYTQDSIVLTSSSYSDGCNSGYTSLSQYLDQTSRSHSSLLHVFSAGNSGGSNCGYGAGSGWGNITGGQKQGKNVIAVGNVLKSDALAGSSSRGPAKDGRIKPDVCAVGTNVYSTYANASQYAFLTGTSMACPGVAGSLALLQEGYRKLNNQQFPNGGLLKGLLMNTAEDIGNPGPDFRHGYGRVNLRRAYRAMQNNWYSYDSLDQAQTRSFSIQVPANLREIRVMTYWQDKPGQVLAARALVNDLDMTVTDPNGNVYQPWVLNPAPNSTTLNQNATRSRDSLNNMEQVTLLTPTPGTYTITVSGFAVPEGPQDFHVVWELLQEELVVVYPAGGEGLSPGTQETIYWDYYGAPGGFSLEYSTNDGSTWTTIASTASTTRNYTWTVPNALSGKARVRVSRGNLSDMGAAPFSIIGVPSGLAFDTICPYSVQLKWNAVAGATGYDVFMLGQQYMDSVGTTSGTSMTIAPVNTAQANWFSVRARGSNEAVGTRARAIRQNPGWGPCTPVYDLAMEAVVFPFAPSSPSCFNQQGPSVQLKNRTWTDFVNVPIHVLANGQVYTDTLDFLGHQKDTVFVFNTPLASMLSGQGPHSLVFWHDEPSDNVNINDTLHHSFSWDGQSAYALPWREDFENQAFCPPLPSCGTALCNLSNGISNLPNGQGDDINWLVWSGPTPTSGTGPIQDFSVGNPNGKYAYLHAFNCSNQIGALESPCLDLSQAQRPYTMLAYHLDSANSNSVHMDVFAAGRWHENVGQYQQGNQNWQTDTLSLMAFVGEPILIRYRGKTGSNGLGSPALDLLRVSDFNPGIQVNDTLCLNQAATIQVGGDGILSDWQWQFGPNANPISYSGENPPSVVFQQTGIQTIQLQVQGHDSSTSVQRQVVVIDLPSANFSSSQGMGGAITLNASGSGIGNYTWWIGNNPPQCCDSIVNTTLAMGTYPVTLVVENPCGSDTVKSDLLVLGLNDWESAGFSLYPNPSTGGQVRLAFTDATVEQVAVYDGRGRQLQLLSIAPGQSEVQIQGQWSAGMYVIRVQTADRHYHLPWIVH